MRSLMNSALVRNFLAVASGTVAGQMIAFAFSPLITRIYSPETFGLQGVFLSLISILSPVIALRYPMAIVLAKNEANAGRLARLSLLIAFALSCLTGLVLLVVHGPILALLGGGALGSLIFFLPLALFGVALQDVANFRAARRKSFRLVGIVAVIHAFLTNLARVMGGLAAPVAGMLVAISSIAPSLQAALFAIGSRGKTEDAAVPLQRRKALALLGEYRDFPLFRVPTDVLNSASQSVPVILLAVLFSPVAAGLYTLTRTVLDLPANLINNAVGNVLYAHFAELAQAGKPLLPLLLRSTGALLALAPIIVGAAWFAPSAFALVFGEEWREAGHYAQWMSLWIAMMVVNVPAIRVVPVINRQGIAMVFNIMLLAVRIFSILIATQISDSALTAIAWFSVSSAIMIIISILLFAWHVVTFDRGREEVKDG